MTNFEIIPSIEILFKETGVYFAPEIDWENMIVHSVEVLTFPKHLLN